MNDLIQRIVNAQIRQENAPPGATNPLNLRSAPWKTGAIVVKGFWAPSSRQEGIAGGAHQVALNIARGLTLAEHISRFAPPNENDTATYIANVKEWAQIPDENVPLWVYIL